LKKLLPHAGEGGPARLGRGRTQTFAHRLKTIFIELTLAFESKFGFNAFHHLRCAGYHLPLSGKVTTLTHFN